MYKRYLVFNIGCIECGVSSGVVGMYDTKEEADNIAGRCLAHLDWRHGGQNEFEVFDLLEPQDPEYTEAILND